MGLKAEIVGENYVISFPYYHPKFVEFCKSLQGARYHPSAKQWSAPRNLPNALDLHKNEVLTDQKTLDLSKPTLTQFVRRGSYIWTLSNYDQMEHQVDWAVWCLSRSKAMLIAEMGLGKTLMSMMWWKAHAVTPGDILVVCPASLVQNWVNEIKKFTGVDALAVQGSAAKKEKILSRTGLHVVNYESFQSDAVKNLIVGKTCIVLDESHKIKTPNTGRSKVLHGYCNDPQRTHILCLTGTPISQGAQDYFSQFKVIEPRLLGTSYTAFKARYCIQEQVRGAPTGVQRIVGYKQLEELTRIVAPYSRTFLKKDCLDLPEKTYETRHVTLSSPQTKAYKELKQEMATFLDSGEAVVAANVLTRLIRFSQITQGFIPYPNEPGRYQVFEDNPKIKALQEIIEGLPPEESLVIMCRFRQDIENIEKLLQKLRILSYASIHGDVPMESRQKIVDAFQEGRIKILVGQITTVGVGFNLTRASTVVFYSNTYSYVDRQQAEDRIHRIGTKGTCLYIDIVAQGTVDEHVLAAVKSKHDVATNLSDLRKLFGKGDSHELA